MLRAAKELDPEIPVIVMTAAVKNLKREMLDPSVVRAVVTKPFDLEKLTAALKIACAPGATTGLKVVE